MGNYRLALDVGTNSVGWCVMPLSDDGPTGISDAGARVFSDGRNPKDGSSNAKARRLARGMRRNHDRFLYRRNALLTILAEGGLLPKDALARRALTALDPYELRARGIENQLALYDPHRPHESSVQHAAHRTRILNTPSRSHKPHEAPHAHPTRSTKPKQAINANLRRLGYGG